MSRFKGMLNQGPGIWKVGLGTWNAGPRESGWGNFRVLPSRFSSPRLGGHGELERPAWRIGYSQAGAIANNGFLIKLGGLFWTGCV